MPLHLGARLYRHSADMSAPPSGHETSFPIGHALWSVRSIAARTGQIAGNCFPTIPGIVPQINCSLGLRHPMPTQHACNMCTCTGVSVRRLFAKIVMGFANRAQVPRRDYMAQPSSPSMRRRCPPTLSLKPTQAQSGINAQEDARGSWSSVFAEPKRLARQARNSNLD